MFQFTHARSNRAALLGGAVLGLLAVRPASAQLSVFSSGAYSLPETISIVPAGFGALGGQIFIPDGISSVIHVVPITGGPEAVFTGPAGLPSGVNSGLFVPASFGGAAAGKYVAFGVDGTSSIVNSSGVGTPFVNITNTQFTTSLIAPASFGAYGGQIIAIDEGVNIQALAINSAGTATKIAGFNFAPFGSLVAPAGFGGVGGKILVDNGNGGDIVALGADGSVTPFANIPLKTGQVGLRQMTIAPAGFFPGVNQPLLLVSITGSNRGGGTLGDVVALDSNGNIIESLRTNLGLTAFDPRGLIFLDGTHLLLSDSSQIPNQRQGEILELNSNAFNATTPEPGTVALLGALFAAGGVCFRSRRARRA